MQDGCIDYSKYSRQELEQALKNINSQQFPQNYENARLALEKIGGQISDGEKSLWDYIAFIRRLKHDFEGGFELFLSDQSLRVFSLYTIVLFGFLYGLPTLISNPELNLPVAFSIVSFFVTPLFLALGAAFSTAQVFLGGRLLGGKKSYQEYFSAFIVAMMSTTWKVVFFISITVAINLSPPTSIAGLPLLYIASALYLGATSFLSGVKAIQLLEGITWLRAVCFLLIGPALLVAGLMALGSLIVFLI